MATQKIGNTQVWTGKAYNVSYADKMYVGVALSFDEDWVRCECYTKAQFASKSVGKNVKPVMIEYFDKKTLYSEYQTKTNLKKQYSKVKGV